MPPTNPPASLEELIATAVERAVLAVLEPYLHRLADTEPLVLTIQQAAARLQLSPDTISRMLRRGTLPRVPHIDGRILIPRRAIEAMVEGHPAASHA